MEQDQDGHNLRECQIASAIAPLGVADQTLLVPFRLKNPTKVIDMAEEFEYTHGEAPFRYLFGFSTHSVAEK
jgi:hypothetical protein